MDSKPRIAIVGAGLSGLTLAHRLAKRAHVVVFEKSRGVAGRMATRYADPFAFDHGTQFFTARTGAFRTWLRKLEAEGQIAEWTGPVVALTPSRTAGAAPEQEERPWREPHYVPTPRMNSLGKHLAQGCDVALHTEVGPLTLRSADGWQLFDAGCNGLGRFDWVISTAPPVQTARIFAPWLPAEAALPQVRMLGCFTLMLGFRTPWDRPWIAAKVRAKEGHSPEGEQPIAWIGVDSSKPGRNARTTCLVVHSGNGWAQAHMEDDLAATQATLTEHLAALTGIDARKSHYAAMQRWRYALVVDPKEQSSANPPYLDPDLQLASTGDWCTASRVEEVWLNAHKLADALERHLG